MSMKIFKSILLTSILTLSVVGLASANGPIETADFGNADLTGGGFCSSFNAEQPGGWGGEYGDGAVTAFADSDPAGYCNITWVDGEKARRIELRVLDGIADDSFDVFVRNPSGNMVLVYSYTADMADGIDDDPGENWEVHQIYSFPAGKGQGSEVDIMIVPTNLGWSGYATFGQLALDYIALYEH
jgi:hypothetical protein